MRPLSPTIAIVAVLAGLATIGNGAAIVCNQLLVQRGAPDAMRGRALAVLMSSYYAVLGLSMAGGGLLVDAAGARVAWGIAGCIYLGAAVLALVLTARIREVSVADRAGRGAGRAGAHPLAHGRDRGDAAAGTAAADVGVRTRARRRADRARRSP